jgi:hypothetical protein
MRNIHRQRKVKPMSDIAYTHYLVYYYIDCVRDATFAFTRSKLFQSKQMLDSISYTFWNMTIIIFLIKTSTTRI